MDGRALNSRVTIQAPSAGVDAIGQPVTTWTTLATVWANIRQQSGAESIRADKDISIVQASIRIRRRTDVTAAMRAVSSSTTYDIRAVLPDEQSREFVDLVCQAAS
ncbi:MAG: phage head closure protein [Polaromonas sp.]